MSALDEVGHLLHSLRGVWDEDAVDELDHALQAAARAATTAPTMSWCSRPHCTICAQPEFGDSRDRSTMSGSPGSG